MGPRQKLLGKLPPVTVQPKPTVIKPEEQAAQGKPTTDLKPVGKTEQPDPSPWPQTPREVMSQVGGEITGVPVVKAKEGWRDPIARWINTSISFGRCQTS